ncbi:MAG: DUF5946 family protein [Bacteroidota bacterium]
MQDYIDIANKNGVTLYDKGKCQFCGADTKRGVHECLEVFNLGFSEIDFSEPENHLYRFFIVDAHTLQHPEIHGRWSNHFHLSRLHLIFKYRLKWTYAQSPRFSDYLNTYKADKPDEYLNPPKPLERGEITSTDVLKYSADETECKQLITDWAVTVYNAWEGNLERVDRIASGYLDKMGKLLVSGQRSNDR